MRIAFNPSTVAALTSPPNNKDITFDLRGRNIFARGVKFYGTDTNTWRDIKINNVSIGSNILDLRDSSNTTLTNVNGVVTINSTWRPVVDNLTSNSATSSLSANQGRVLAGLINGKSDSDHNHDGRYLKLTGGTLTGNLVGTSAIFSGRFYGNGDDEGIIIKPSSSGYAGLILGTHDGERSVFYFVKDKPFWRYSHGSDKLDIIHPKKSGIIALTSDIPNKNSWNYDDRYLKLTGGTMLLGEGLKFHANDHYFGNNADARIISLLDNNDKICNGGLIIDERTTLDGKEYATELLRIRDSEFKWRGADILHSGNYSGILDSRYYTESEVNSLLSKKLDRVNLTTGSWNPRGYNLAAAYFYNGGALSISESGGQIHVSVDGYFWQNEGRYRVLDTSDVAGLKSDLTVYQYLSNTDVTWRPLIWGGSSHANTRDSTGAVYKSYDKLSWQTSSQTLYATNIQTENIKRLSIGGGIYWNPDVESATNGSDAASITLVKSGVAGGTTLVLSQMNDYNDTIQFKTNDSARLYHNSYPILTTQNTHVSNNKGYINGTEITQVNNADKVDNRHAISTIPNTGIIYKAAIYISSSLTSYWVRLASIPSINYNNEFVATIHVQSGHTYPGKSAILLVYLRGAASSLLKSFRICCNSNYAPIRFRLYYKDSDKTSEIWYQTVSQWDGIITTVISQSSEGSLYEGLTLYSGNITATQTPSMSTYLSAQVSTITDNISGNASTATKLATPRKIWGQSFDGTRDVNGTIYINNGDSNNGAIRLNNNINSNARISAIDNKIIFNTGGEIRFGETDWNYDKWAGLKYTYSNKTIYLGIADGSEFTASSPKSNGTLKLPGITTITTNPGTRIGNSGGDLYLGNANNNGQVKVQDICSHNGSDYWYISQSGNAIFNYIKSKTNAYIVGNLEAGQIIRGGSSQFWVNGRNGALLRETSVVGYHTLWSLKTTDGSWDFGEYSISDWYNIPVLSYITDSNYNSGNNAVTYQIKFPLASGTVALTSQASSFNVNTAQYLRSLGNKNCQTGRIQAYGDVYTYNTYYGNTGSPTSYTSVIGFGRGTGGTVEIAGGWCNTNLYWRSLRDCCEDWYSWRTVLDSNNYTDFIGNYYWANVKISASSSTTTSPTVHTLTATRICAGHDPKIDNSISCSNWFRSSGNTGWYNTTYQGGWYMSDTSWIRAYNGVGIYTSGQIYSSSSIRMSNILLEHTDEINNITNGGIHLNYRNSGNISLCQGGGNVGIGTMSPTYKLDVNGQMRTSGFHHSSVNSDNYMLLAGGGYKSFGGGYSNPIFLGYLNLDHGNDGTISSSFLCLGYSVPFTYTRGGNYCRIYIPDTTHQVFYIKAAIASVNYSGGGMDTWTNVRRGAGAWWLHCYVEGANEVRVKGFCQKNNNNDSWWGGNPLWSGNDGANRITVCIFGYVELK